MALRERGFSLLETVVAFAIAAIVLVMLGQIFASGARNARLADSYAAATMLAQSLLDEITIDNSTYPERGKAGQFEWTLERAPFHDESSQARTDTNTRILTDLTVTVSWTAGLRNPQVALSRLALLSPE